MSELVQLRRDREGPPVGWVSGSALATAVKCAASLVLPRILGTTISASKLGTALHEHVRHRNIYGMTEAIAKLPELVEAFEMTEDEESLFIARAKAFEWAPPPGAVAELALCLFEDGRVEAVRGGKGMYDLPADALIPAQIDIFWAEPRPLYRDGDRIVCPPDSILWVIDFKSGKEDYVEPAERNAQALASAVLAGKFTGARLVVPGIVYLRKGQGIWDIPERPLDLPMLAHVEEILRGAVLEVRRLRAAYEAGQPISFREGPHCSFCRARHGCPAHVATLRHWLADPGALAPGALTDAQARTLAELAPAFNRFAASVNEALRTHVQVTGKPIPLSDGRVWGMKTVQRDAFDVERALPILEGELKEDARVAVRRLVSTASIERAVEASHKRRKIVRQKSSAMRRIYARLADAGGVRKVARVEWGAHKPKPELPSVERDAAIAALHGLPIDGDDLEEDDDT